MGRKHRVATQLAVKNHGLFDSCMGPAPPAHHRPLGKWNGCPRCRACTPARLSESLISHSFPQTRFSYYIRVSGDWQERPRHSWHTLKMVLFAAPKFLIQRLGFID